MSVNDISSFKQQTINEETCNVCILARAQLKAQKTLEHKNVL